MDVKFFKCMHCGNVAIKPFDQGVPMNQRFRRQQEK